MKRKRKSRFYRLFIGGLLMCFMLFGGAMTGKAAIYPSKYKVPDKVKQLAVVSYKGNSKGMFRYYERRKNGTWKQVFRCTAYIGKKGIGKKKEGDMKTPKGLYSLGQTFGICKNPGTKMPYVKVNRYHYWCGDSGSKYYNQLIRTDKTGHRCKGEHLINYKGVYDYSIFIGYNKKGKAKKGSAIFLHCSKGKATAGCVAIPKKQMKQILRRLRPDACPKILIYKQ